MIEQPITWISFSEFSQPRREARRNQELEEVEIKSDFGKWLLIGGGVLIAYYLLRGKRK